MNAKELWLIWRSNDLENRSRYKIGVLKRNPENNTYTFSYNFGDELVAAKKAGFTSFPGFENLYEPYQSNGLFQNIIARLPKPERDDYLDILNRYNLSPNANKYDILCATKGRQVTDNYEFVPAFDDNKIEFDIAGVNYRESEKLEKAALDGFLASGAKLILEREKDNKYDKFATKILLPTGTENIFIGYVPKYYSEQLARKLDEKTDYSAVIAKVDLGSKIRDEKISAVVRLMFAE